MDLIFTLGLMAVSPKIKLNNGREMPIFGLGTYLSEDREAERAVCEAIDAGYRHIDTAFFYGNEEEVGAAIRKKIEEGVIKREDIFVTTKLWITFQTYDLALKMCKESNNALGLGYIDLYLIHCPIAVKPTANLWPQNKSDLEQGNTSYLESWKALEECVRLGLTKSIGLSNFNSVQIDKVLSICTIKPVCNQVETNPNINNIKLVEFCKTRDIIVTGHTPLGRAGVSDPSWPKPTIFNAKVIEIGKKYNKTAAQVILRFLIQIDVCPLPKSVKKTRIIENIQVFDFELNNEEMEFMKSLNTNQRVCSFEPFVNHKDYPFSLEF